MKNPLKSQFSTNLGLLLVRLPVGALFIIAGFNKIKGGVGEFVKQAQGTIPSYLPDFLGKTYLYLLPAVELLVGRLIVLGLFSRTAGLVSSLIMISIMMAVTGIFDPPKPFHANVIILGVTLLVLLTGPGGIALDNIRFRGSSVKPKKSE